MTQILAEADQITEVSGIPGTVYVIPKAASGERRRRFRRRLRRGLRGRLEPCQGLLGRVCDFRRELLVLQQAAVGGCRPGDPP